MKLVLLPGLDGTGLLHDEFKKALKPITQLDVMTYPTALTSYADLADHISPLLPTDERYVLVAESFAGPLAVILAARAGTNLRGIAFVASFTARVRAIPPVFAKALAYMPLRTSLFLRLMQLFTINTLTRSPLSGALKTAIASVPPHTLADRLTQTLQSRHAATPKHPMLYLRANHDRLVPKRHARQFADKGAKVVDIEGPHFLLQMRPILCAEAVMDFTRRL